jgi:hypothetical protein
MFLMPLKKNQEWIIEHHIFFDLCRRFRQPEAELLYSVLQAALAFGATRLDAGRALGELRPPKYTGLDDGYCPPLTGGIPFLHWLYEVELVKKGESDYHVYRFTRRHDQKKVEVKLKTTGDPESEGANQRFAKQLAKLEKARTDLKATHQYGLTTTDAFKAFFPGIRIVSLDDSDEGESPQN